MKAAEYLMELRHALARVGMGFTCYCVALCILEGRASSIAGIAARVGLTRKGVRDILTRRSALFFTSTPATSPQRYELSADGIRAMQKVLARLPSAKPARQLSRRRPESRRLQLLLNLDS